MTWTLHLAANLICYSNLKEQLGCKSEISGKTMQTNQRSRRMTPTQTYTEQERRKLHSSVVQTKDPEFLDADMTYYPMNSRVFNIKEQLSCKSEILGKNTQTNQHRWKMTATQTYTERERRKLRGSVVQTEDPDFLVAHMTYYSMTPGSPI